MPALLMRTSIGPWVNASSMTRSATVGSLRSPTIGTMSSSSTAAAIDASLRAVPMIVAPCARSVRRFQTDTSRGTGDQNTSSRQIHPPKVVRANGGHRNNPLAITPDLPLRPLLPHAESGRDRHASDAHLVAFGVFMLIVAWGIWEFAAPDLTRAESLAVGWIAQIWIRNIVLVGVIAGALHWWLWMMAQQDLRYDTRPMGKNKRLLFDDQVKDNLALTLVSAMLIGTLWESVGWWAMPTTSPR